MRSRALVLAAAAELLAEHGVTGTTIEAVAARSGVARTTVYRHWPGQSALVLDAFATALPAPHAPDTGSLRGDLRALVDGLSHALITSPAGALMAALMAGAERDAGLAALHHGEAERRHRVVAVVLDRARARGELGSHVDPDELVDLLAGPLFHRRFVTGRPLDASVATRVVDLVMAALGIAERGEAHGDAG